MPGFRINQIGGTPNFPFLDGQAEYLYKYTWTIENLFIPPPPTSRGTIPIGSVTGIAGDSPEIHLRDVTLPTFTANKEVVMGGSVEYKFAKSVSWDDIKVTWYDTVGMLGVMRQWRALVWTPTGGLAVARDYKRRSTIAHYLPHDTSTVNRHILINSWPSVIRHGELTYTESEVNLVEVTITYDWSEGPQIP